MWELVKEKCKMSLILTIFRFIFEQISPSGSYENIPYINKFESTFKLAGGINLPKIISCCGSDGTKSRQLVKVMLMITLKLSSILVLTAFLTILKEASLILFLIEVFLISLVKWLLHLIFYHQCLLLYFYSLNSLQQNLIWL